MATKLMRAKLENKGLEEITDEKFVKEAKNLLGYKVLDMAWTFKQVIDILNKLGIQPIDNEKVEAYKKEKAEAMFKRSRSITDYGVSTTTTRGEWVMLPLSGYRNEVPAFALLRAADVKRALNKANIKSEFYVEELQKRTTRSEARPAFDPFMVLEISGNRRLYLDVWDEPKFEGRRTV